MKQSLIICMLILLLSLRPSVVCAQPPVATHAAETDVVVYGSTPGGFCAAIAAAREGAAVILLEPTQHVGGMNTGGLSWSDSNQTVRSTVMGLFDEWHRRISADYEQRGVTLPYDVNVKDATPWTYEPHVAARVTRHMLEEAGVSVLTGRRLMSVVKDGVRITTLVTSDGSFSAKVFIDASYEGDLMAAAGVSCTSGREGRDEFGESLAGMQYPKDTMLISGFDDVGIPLPLITATATGPEEAGDDNVMVYSFRLCLTADPTNRIPFPAPEKYDPARFEVVRRHLENGGGGVGFDLYPLPGDKFDGNNSIGGQFSLGLVGAGSGWSHADEFERAAIWESHQQYTLEFYQFLTTDPAVPEDIRNRFSRLGLCRDEFPEHDHWPPQLYIRESRRLQGQYVLCQRDILEEPRKDDPIVVASFPIDSHDCRRIALDDGGVINEGTIFPVRMQGRRNGYAYHVPYRAILPQSAECENLLVPVALSCTHVAMSSIRVEPTWMILGHSAGIAAALSAREGVSVQELPYPTLRESLLAQGQVLDLPSLPELSTEPGAVDPEVLPGIVLDDADAELQGEWASSTNFTPFIGDGYLHDQRTGDGESTATFQFESTHGGRYKLLMAYSPHETRATNVPVVVTSGASTTTFVVDQTERLPQTELFRLIGMVDLTADAQSTITITNANTDGFVILDALQLLPAE